MLRDALCKHAAEATAEARRLETHHTTRNALRTPLTRGHTTPEPKKATLRKSTSTTTRVPKRTLTNTTASTRHHKTVNEKKTEKEERGKRKEKRQERKEKREKRNEKGEERREKRKEKRETRKEKEKWLVAVAVVVGKE